MNATTKNPYPNDHKKLSVHGGEAIPSPVGGRRIFIELDDKLGKYNNNDSTTDILERTMA